MEAFYGIISVLKLRNQPERNMGIYPFESCKEIYNLISTIVRLKLDYYIDIPENSKSYSGTIYVYVILESDHDEIEKAYDM